MTVKFLKLILYYSKQAVIIDMVFINQASFYLSVETAF